MDGPDRHRLSAWGPSALLAALLVVVPTALASDGFLSRIGAVGEQRSYVELAFADPSRFATQVLPDGTVRLRVRVVHHGGGTQHIRWSATTMADDGRELKTDASIGEADLGSGQSAEPIIAFTMACERRTKIRIGVTEPASEAAIHLWVDSVPAAQQGAPRATPTCRV